MVSGEALAPAYLTIGTLNHQSFKLRTPEKQFMVHTIVKEYPMKFRIFTYKTPFLKKDDYWEEDITKKTLKPQSRGKSQNPELSLESSIKRTKTHIADLILCNDFNLFGTLTISPKKADRYNDKEVRTKLENALSNIQRKYKIQYLIVPERHKDGALHFHTLLKGVPPEALFLTKVRDTKGRKIYNWKDYNLGHSNFSYVESKEKTANYVKKYVTKELSTEANKRRYWASKDLIRPKVSYNSFGEVQKAYGTSTDFVYVTPLYMIEEVKKTK